VRLGVYVADHVYRLDGETLSTDLPVIEFLGHLAARIDALVLFGRLHPEPGRTFYTLPRERVRFVPFPYYPSLVAGAKLLRTLPRAAAAFSREAGALDAVWLFGPHPMSLVMAGIAHRRRVPIFLAVRQDLPRYVRNRLSGAALVLGLPAAVALEQTFRLLARSSPTVAIGEVLARNYRRGRAPVLTTGFSLVADAELVALEDALARRWDGDLRLISVGRLDPEKNPLLLVEVLAELRRRQPRWRLAIVGDGRLADAVGRRARERGVADALELLGHIPHGAALWQQYRSSHAFLHVSLTEGLPQVLVEAHAAGLPIVATDVGGVRAALAGGSTGLLVPPGDARAAVGALERLTVDAELRRRLVEAGLESARRQTMEAQLDCIVEFFRSQLAAVRTSEA
jgi:glycosyltransferase involved in cell wall biosynthesis